jgi:glycosyltransferase involved in cell wall biosynthesis
VHPKISIITPSFNQATFLERTIQSVIRQDYSNYEYIVIDGASTDESVEIIKKYGDKLAYWVSEKDRGQSHAINKGFKRATGDIFCWINSDDCLKPGALSCVAKQLSNYQDCLWLVGACELIDEQGNPIDIRKINEISLSTFANWNTNWFTQQSTFWTRTLLDKVGLLNESLHYAMDYDLWLRMFAESNPIAIDRVLAQYRFHSKAKCVNDKDKDKQLIEVAEVIDKFIKESLVLNRYNLDEIMNLIKGSRLNYAAVYSAEILHYKSKLSSIEDSRTYKIAKVISNLKETLRRKF